MLNNNINTDNSSTLLGTNPHHRKKLIFKILLSVIMTIFFAFLFIFSAPSNFPVNKVITIEKGITLTETANKLEEEKIVRSSIFFDMLLRYTGYESRVKAGKYMFEKKLSNISLMSRLIKGDYGIPAVKITFPEGSTIKDMNRILKNGGFSDFEIKDLNLEGRLFPDTYFFSIDSTIDIVVKKMQENFDNKISNLIFEIQKSGRPFEQILKIASLIEKEAANLKDRKIISGILWKRFDSKMPLQVDATFAYTIGKNTYELTIEDLKMDSPYNTYRRVGFPPTPICNPGLDAIIAAISPEKSLYWYYLSDKNGKIYYAKTFEEHKVNKARYLK